MKKTKPVEMGILIIILLIISAQSTISLPHQKHNNAQNAGFSDGKINSLEFTCQPDDIPEGEPICYDNYSDHYNSGCGHDPPLMQPIPYNQTICGTSGTFLYNGLNVWDTDWYEIDHIGGDLIWYAETNIPLNLLLLEVGDGDCSNYTVYDFITINALQNGTLTYEDAPEGIYWLWIGPAESTGWPCGSIYRTRVTYSIHCIGDINGDGVVDVSDLLILLAAWGELGGSADINGDGIVNVEDLLILLANWTH